MRRLILGLILASMGFAAAATSAAPAAATTAPTAAQAASTAATPTAIRAATAPAPARATTAPPVILVFGDSISAGYGLGANPGWVGLLDVKLKAQGYGYQMINASVSGETTAGGLARLPRALSVHRPAIVILELGANDGLRALPAAQMRANLMRMVSLSQQAKAAVLLVGMRMPPNYGPRYTEQFHQVYDEVARYFKIPLVPFLLDGVATDAKLMQADNLHPNVAAQPKLLETVWPALERMLKK